MRATLVGAVAAAILALGVSGVWAGEGGKEKEKEKEVKVPLAELPAVVKEAAAKAVPGIVLTEAEKVTKGDQVIYEVEGKANGKEYEIQITAEGKVLKVKQENDKDDKDDKDDDD